MQGDEHDVDLLVDDLEEVDEFGEPIGAGKLPEDEDFGDDDLDFGGLESDGI
jgi:hypothetical protein